MQASRAPARPSAAAAAACASDRKSTRLNSSHPVISYAVFCLKKSEIFVISQDDAGFTDRPLAGADYYDMLIHDAFANYSQMLGDVTLSPAIGIYHDVVFNRTQ